MHASTFAAIPAALSILATLVPAALAASEGEEEAEPPPAHVILRDVVRQLPPDPIRITGELLVRRRRGVPVATYRFEMTTRWGDEHPRSDTLIRDALGRTLERLSLSHGATPVLHHGTDDLPDGIPVQSLASPVQDTDISWMDLTLSFLWWTDARHVGRESILNFDCHVLDVFPPPDSAGPYARVRLWITRNSNMMIEAVGFDSADKPVRRLWIRSVKKIDDAWMVKEMEVQAYPVIHRTKLHIEDVERLRP